MTKKEEGAHTGAYDRHAKVRHAPTGKTVESILSVRSVCALPPPSLRDTSPLAGGGKKKKAHTRVRPCRKNREIHFIRSIHVRISVSLVLGGF